MAQTVAGFIAAYPEFAAGDQTFMQVKLNEAIRQIDIANAGALADDLVYCLTAQKLAKSPMGNTAKLVNKDGVSVYDAELDRLYHDVAGGFGIT